jgi:hypothetical protein
MRPWLAPFMPVPFAKSMKPVTCRMRGCDRRCPQGHDLRKHRMERDFLSKEALHFTINRPIR